MINPDDDLWLVGIAWRLDRLRWVPRVALAEMVRGQGLYSLPPADHVPPWQDENLSDRELAARLCAECPVQDECLELELRVAGVNTVGVWGGLSEIDRRALHPHWRRRGERAEATDTPCAEGGAWS